MNTSRSARFFSTAALVLLSGTVSLASTATDKNPTVHTIAQVRSLPWVSGPCQDARLPLISGGWAIGCRGSARPNRAQHVVTQEKINFEAPGKIWGVGAGRIVDLSNRKSWSIPNEPANIRPISSQPHAPIATDGKNMLISSVEKLEWMEIGSKTRNTIPSAKPLPWYPPSISEATTAWVEWHPDTGEDVWTYTLHNSTAKPLAQSKAHERHVVVDGKWIAWLTDHAVFLKNQETGDTQTFSGQVHSNERLSLSNGIVCWEAHTKEDIDIFCSDGLHLKRKDNQRRPSRWMGWLLFHEGENTLLYGPIE